MGLCARFPSSPAIILSLFIFLFLFPLFSFAQSAFLGDLDLAEHGEILRNRFRRITPENGTFVQDIGTLPAAFDLFSPAWDSAPAVRSLATWLVPFSLSLENGASVLRDTNGNILWRGPVDFARPESSGVTLVGTLVAEDDFPLYAAAREEIARRLAPPPAAPRSLPATNALRFTSLSLDTNGVLQLDLASPADGPVEIFARSMAYTSSVVTVVWTNDENTVVTNTSTQWQQAPGEAFHGTSDVWTCLGLATVSNGIASFADPAITNDDYRVCFYVAQPFADSDSDGLSDASERWTFHTAPHVQDSDGDGVPDGAEVSMGFDPGDANDCPKVMLHAVFYNPSGTDTGQEWVEIYSASARSVDLSGMALEIGRPSGWTSALQFSPGTVLSPGRSLLVGESLVTNADISATLDIPNAWTNEPTAGLRLCWSSFVIDTVFIGGEESFNSAQLDTAGWLSQNSVWAHAGTLLERRFPGVDNDRAADWHEVSLRAGNPSPVILDFDADGIPDGDEWTGAANPFGESTNPWNPDSDGDGLSDYDECLVHLSNPNTWDTDGDIYPFMPPGTPPASWPGTDPYELSHNGDPAVPDENANGIPDSWEAALPPGSLDGIVDSDSDGIDNLSELLQNSNPLDPSDSSPRPFALVFESSAPGWINGATDNDVNLGGSAQMHVLGASEGDSIVVGISEGNVPEEFSVQWDGADEVQTLGNRNSVFYLTRLSGNATMTVTDGACHPDYTGTLGGEYTFTPRYVDLDVMQISHNQPSVLLPDGEELSSGAFLPVNDDDDDYDEHNTPDKDQTGAIVGETDLLPVVLRAASPVVAGETYTLDIPSHFRVWQNADRTGPVTSSSQFPADADTPLYVEAISAGEGMLKLNWQSALASVPAADSIRLTAFEWVGPLNVPDYSIHRYTATAPRSDSQWLSPVGGTINEGDGSSDVRIFWAAGPVVGKAVYQASPDYVWDLEVNVVQVIVDTPPNAFVAGIPFDSGTNLSSGILTKFIRAGNPGLTWEALITLNGPRSDRGLNRIIVGFIQNLIGYANVGIYQTDGIRLEGNFSTPLPILDKSPASSGPWWKETDATLFANTTRRVKRKYIASRDSPDDGPPLCSHQEDAISASSDIVDENILVFQFRLSVCAATRDEDEATRVYARRASVDWSFNGSGQVSQTSPYEWTGNNAHVAKPQDWMPVMDGSQPDKLDGTTLNEALANIQFTPVSQP